MLDKGPTLYRLTTHNPQRTYLPTGGQNIVIAWWSGANRGYSRSSRYMGMWPSLQVRPKFERPQPLAQALSASPCPAPNLQFLRLLCNLSRLYQLPWLLNPSTNRVTLPGAVTKGVAVATMLIRPAVVLALSSVARKRRATRKAQNSVHARPKTIAPGLWRSKLLRSVSSRQHC